MSDQGSVNALDLLTERGFIADVTDRDGLRDLFERERVTAYVGFDPTAASLHAGNLVGIMALAWLQRAGHRPIALVGGATGRIGDPSFRDEERALLPEDVITGYVARIREQLGRFLDLSGADRGMLVDNYTWTADLRLLDFLRDVGKHFSVNQMIARESVKRRLESREQGISYTEFSYQLLQAFDFSELYATAGCRLQGGGTDQWGNIVAGVDLTRRLQGAEVFGVVWPLVEGSDGKKFSKTAGNAPMLDGELTSPYAYYQWWLNTDDRDIGRFLRLFTFLPLAEIDEIVAKHEDDPAARFGQRRLAEEATRICHGDDALGGARRATAVLFGSERFEGLDDRTLEDAFEAAPSVDLPRSRLEEGIGLLELLVASGASSSNSDARRLVEQGGVRVNNVRVDDPKRVIGPDDLASRSLLVLRVGRRRYHLARFT
ncbi:MAG: tyrosine--tRNA ligase [Nitriliruptorales bacterium]